ncbi:SDR family NAD(P)-dependent oxidoreductase [Metapseudomonas otitidis]|uniref:SDR family NAD(P)-dependent oxidoreductase n=1 Tax=Metapseudomonas otitidis TaxID=319939 RepID=UPI004055679E
MRSFVITGVSSGIGLAAARRLCAEGMQVFGSVRRAADGERLRAELGDRFVPLLFDVTDEAAVRRGASQVREALAGRALAGLVNNAGVARPGPLLTQSISEVRDQMEVNIVGQVIALQAFVPLLGVEPGLKGPRGRVVMISSDAGCIAAPFLGAYSASKHAVEGLAESLRRELLLFGIDVVIIGPGFVATDIWDKAEAVDFAPHRGTPYEKPLMRLRDYMLEQGRKGYPAERIADAIWRALDLPSPPTRYAEVQGRLMNWTLPRLLPRRVVDRMIGRQLGLLPPA